MGRVTEALEWFAAGEELGFEDYDEPVIPRRRHWVNAILVTHEGATWLTAVLTSIAGQTRPPDAIVGVDNASTDGSVRLLRESLGPARVVETGINAGFGGAIDEGLRALGNGISPMTLWSGCGCSTTTVHRIPTASTNFC